MPWPWKVTLTPASMLAVNEKGENMKRASNPTKPCRRSPAPEALSSARAPTCAVFEVSAR